MKYNNTLLRPKTLHDVADSSNSLHDFGINLKDWQHEIQRGGIHSRRELKQRLTEAPILLANYFEQGDVADAYRKRIGKLVHQARQLENNQHLSLTQRGIYASFFLKATLRPTVTL